VEPPYALVGHSFGGFDVRLYASENRSQVSGMVLVDASSETMYNGGAGDGGKILLEPCRVATRLGVFSVLAQLRVIPTPVTGSFYRPGWCTSLLGELASIDVSAREVRLHRHFLGRLPLVVLTRDIHQRRTGDTRQTLRRWWHLQTGLARLSSQSLHVMVKHSGHAIPTERPGYVIWAIQRVVREARANAGRR
jgi:pimeloyl-ACP methyl ester carboxylesterase